MSKESDKISNKILNTKLAIGTAQFGLIYGINNQSGVIDDVSLFKLLNYAKMKAIDTLDTAYNYGNSEKRIGQYLSNTNSEFKIISKAPKNSNNKNLITYFNESLARLGVNRLYGYMLHNFDDYRIDKNILLVLKSLKERELVKKIGFSLYYPEQLEQLFKENIQFDLLQIPYNIADRRFEPYFSKLKNMDIEVYTRSVFLQGLFFMGINNLPDKLKEFIPLIKKINNISKTIDKDIEEILLNFVLENKYIDKVVLGVDNIVQLNKNIKASENKLSHEELELVESELNEIKISQELLIPSNWN